MSRKSKKRSRDRSRDRDELKALSKKVKTLEKLLLEKEKENLHKGDTNMATSKPAASPSTQETKFQEQNLEQNDSEIVSDSEIYKDDIEEAPEDSDWNKVVSTFMNSDVPR